MCMSIGHEQRMNIGGKDAESNARRCLRSSDKTEQDDEEDDNFICASTEYFCVEQFYVNSSCAQ